MNLPQKGTSAFLQQCGLILTENRTKGSQHPEKSCRMSLKKPGELFVKIGKKKITGKLLSNRALTELKNGYKILILNCQHTNPPAYLVSSSHRLFS